MKRIYGQKFLVLLHPLSNIETKYFNYEPRFNGIWRNNLPTIKDEANVINLDDKKAKEHVGFLYLLRKILMFTSILLELNIFLIKCSAKSKINLTFIIPKEYNVMILLRVDFIASLS